MSCVKNLSILTWGLYLLEKVYFLRHFDLCKIVKCPLAMTLIKRMTLPTLLLGVH